MQTALYWYSICIVALFFKMLALSLYQGFHRIGKKSYKNPEDAASAGVAPLPEELPQVRRAAQAWQNDVENIAPFFALGIVYVLVGASATAAPWYFLTFTAARFLHSYFYLSAMQPWRTVAYGIGVICLIGMSVNILSAI